MSTISSPSPASPLLAAAPVRLLARATLPRLKLMGRPRPVALLDEISARVIWLAAQAGAGKTGLALEWVQHGLAQHAVSGRHWAGVIWLRHDEADQDPVACLTDVAQAVRQSGMVSSDWQAPPWVAEHLTHLAIRLRQWVRALVAALQQPTLIVLDDAHTCQHAAWHVMWLQVLAEELPEQCRLLVLSRRPPPSRLARAQAQGWLEVPPASALGFDETEAAHLFDLLGCPNVRTTMPALFEAAHGWPAGVVLLAQWAKQRPQRMHSMPDILLGDSAPVAWKAADKPMPVPAVLEDYFSTEVFEALPEADREVLLASAVLPYVHPTWLARLCADELAPDRLLALAQQGMLLYGYADGSWTLHPLFRRFLQERAKDDIDADVRERWLIEASALLQEDKRPDLAVELALTHAAYAQASAAMLPLLPALVVNARHATVMRWIAALPAAYNSPVHRFWQASAQFLTHPRLAREALLALFNELPKHTPLSLRQRSLGLIASSFYFNSDSDETIAQTMTRLMDAEQEWEACANDSERTYLVHALWTTCAMVQPGEAPTTLWLQRAWALMFSASDPVLRVRLSVIAGWHLYCGGWHQQLLHMDELMRNAQSVSSASYAAYLSRLLMLHTYTVRGDWAGLQTVCTQALEDAEQSGIHNMDAHYLLYQALAYTLLGDYAAAAQVLGQLAGEITPSRGHLRCHYHSVQTLLALHQPAWDVAQWHIQQMKDIAQRCGNQMYVLQNLVLEIQLKTLRVVQEAAPSECVPDEAWSETLAALKAQAQRVGHPMLHIHADVAQARWALHVGDDATALLHAQAALTRIEATGLGLVVLGVQSLLAPICMLALRHGVAVATAQAVIRVMCLKAPYDAPSTWPRGLMLQLLGTPVVTVNGDVVPTRGQARRKLMELLCWLALQDPIQGALVQDCADDLWPDADGDAAHHALETTLSRLRAWIGRERVWHRDGRLGLSADDAWCDVWFANASSQPNHAFVQVLDGWDQDWVKIFRKKWIRHFNLKAY